MARYDVVVIGAGLGGLTTGAILARAGRKVLVIERSNSVGGAARGEAIRRLMHPRHAITHLTCRATAAKNRPHVNKSFQGFTFNGAL